MLLNNTDELGIGLFCNALWQDQEGLYCSTKAAEGHRVCHCGFTEDDCHVEDGRIRCSRGGRYCEDFEPAKILRERLLP